MNILSFFRPKAKTPPPAEQAKERLKIVLAHERSYAAAPDFLPRMQSEILQVIAKYVAIDQENLSLNVENSDNVSRLEVNIDLPKTFGAHPISSSDAGPASDPAVPPAGTSGTDGDLLDACSEPLRQAASH
jgi:cell division topological specificity factor